MTRAKKRTETKDPLVHHVHDYGYKILFSNVTIFRQLLETFVDQPWVKELDFSKAETVSHSFISKDYKKTERQLLTNEVSFTNGDSSAKRHHL